MVPLTPVAAFQAICIAAAAGLFAEARKEEKKWVKIALWGAVGACIVIGVLASAIADAWPAIRPVMETLGTSPVVWFVTAVAVYFMSRPLWKTSPDASKASITYDDTKLRGDIAELSQTVRAVIDDYQRMSGLEARVDGQIDSLKLAVQTEAETRQSADAVIEMKANEGADLANKVENIRVDTAIANRDIERLANVQEDHRERAQSAFSAIRAREQLAELQALIEQDAADLYNPLKMGELYDEARWDRWESVHSHWQVAIETWLDTARWYAIAVKERTLTVDDKKYSYGWTIADTQFPNAEAVRRFKKFRIIQQQWEAVIPSVKAGLEQVAFVGLTEAEARSGRPAG